MKMMMRPRWLHRFLFLRLSLRRLVSPRRPVPSKFLPNYKKIKT
jgi:hypothetical protein